MSTATDPAAERMRFFPRQLIGADDLNRAQDYHRRRLREHNRLLHGWGVVSGAGVTPDPTSSQPWQVKIEPGYLVTPQGDTVAIRADVLFDLASCGVQSADRCAFGRPCPPLTRRRLDASRTVYVAIRYTECESHPVRVSAHGCSCGEAECEYSRIVEAFELTCLDQLPVTHQTPPADCAQVLSRRIVPHPGCPEDPWVVLATVQLPADPKTPLADVDPLTDRQLLPSVRSLLEMVRCLSPQPQG